MSPHLAAVLGMHRSGTSTIARALAVFGISLGDRLQPAAVDNERGFWEDIDVVRLNERALRSLGRSWASLTPVSIEETARLRDAGFVAEATALLRQRLDKSPRYGFKDPRCARLGALWRAAIDAVGSPATAVIVLRHPGSVARSLHKRNAIAAERSHLLWLDYTLTSLRASAGLPRLLVDYDTLLARPKAELARIGQTLGLAADEGDLQQFVDNFLDEGLRHSRFTAAEIDTDPAVPALVAAVYKALQRQAEDGVALDHPRIAGEIDDWWAEFIRLRPLLVAGDAADTVEEALTRDAVETATRERKAALERMHALADELGRVQVALDAAQRLAQERAESQAAIQAALDQTQALAFARHDEIVQLGARVETVQAALDQTQALAFARHDEIVQLGARVETVQQALDEAQALALQRWDQLLAVARERHALDAELQAIKRRLAGVEADLSRIDAERARLQATYDTVVSSLSWRLTRPFRYIAAAVVAAHGRLR